MNAWYLLSAPAWLVLAVTAVVRLADLERDGTVRVHLRLLGLTLAGCIAGVQLLAPFTLDWWRYADASWEGLVVGWAFALVWLTTPNLPPWYDLVLGVHRNTDAWRALGWRARIRGEWRALRDSFRLTRRRSLT